MLCSLSASLMRITRTSFTMAKSILRIVSACCRDRDERPRRTEIFVTPCTRDSTSLPNSLRSTARDGLGVLQHVVEERGDDALRVHADVDEDRGDAQRVDEERVARGAFLLAVQAPRPVGGGEDLLPFLLGDTRRCAPRSR